MLVRNSGTVLSKAQLCEQGLDKKLTLYDRSELSEGFDQMAEKIQTLVHSQHQLFRDISHEIRTPLTRQQLALELAKRKYPEEELLSRIEKQSEEINRLIEQILSLSRLTETDSPLQKSLIHLPTMINELVSNNQIEAEHRGVRLLTQYNEPGSREITAHCDASLVYGALENILRNAIKHTKKDSSVTISLGTSAKNRADAVITISDCGPGVPESDLDHLFTPFLRVDSARNRKLGGYGLGLAIARKAVERHGGSVQANNLTTPRTGLRLSLTLPGKA